MDKIEWRDQYKHPQWQRVRLQVMQLAGFKCQMCGADDETLNVHHKTYIKGRLIWEYELDNFESLCNCCHEDAHKAKDRIMAVMRSVPSVFWEEMADFMTGYMNDRSDAELDAVEPFSFELGKLACSLERLLSIHDIFEWERQIEEKSGTEFSVTFKKHKPFISDGIDW